jgi:hypothetical protein
MSKLMAWMKANISIVASIAVIVLVLPAAWFGSSWWNNRIRTSREQAAEKVDRDIQQIKVSYQIPNPLPNAQAITVPADAPNPALTAFFKEHRHKLDQQIEEVIKAAQAINQADHKPLVDGLFPNPTDKLLQLTLIETLAGNGPGKPSAYETLLKSINAGGPADPAQLSELLNEEHTRAIERYQAEHNTDKMTTEDDAALAKTLAQLRLSEYKRHARTISVYGTTDAFPQAPRSIPPEPPELLQCWQWQFDYWVFADLLRAVDAANRPDGKGKGGVEGAVVKRIEVVTVEPMALPTPGQPGQPAQAAAASAATLTGRKAVGGLTAPYDLRNADLQVVVSSARLPELMSAISRSNFMTVTGIEFTEMDPWADLEQGYYYGTEPVVRARLHLETVWLRSWTMPLMPDVVKDAIKASEAPPPEPPPPPPPPVVRDPDAKPVKKKPPQKRPGAKNLRGGD